MKVLITSGGTDIPIDSIRSITNKSKGTFGSLLAKKIFESGNDVIFFYKEGTKTPFKKDINLYKFDLEYLAHYLSQILNEFKNIFLPYRDHYKESTFKTYNDYSNGLENLIKSENPDVIVLAAAVSDYGTCPVEGKIKTNDSFTIEFKPLPKVISKVREWSPKSVLVGFKLLVNSPEKELIEAARKLCLDNDCDFVVANDLNNIKENEHKVIIVNKNSESELSFNNDINAQAKFVVDQIIQEYNIKFGKIL